MIKTISGERSLKAYFKHCKEHGPSNQALVSVLNRICPPLRTFDLKVMIAVGILRWVFDYQREEVQRLLSARGTKISTGEISNLSEEFLLRFYALHKRRAPKMRSLFNKNGGMVLHLDGTGEAGDEIVFTAKEGGTGITIDARTMPSESRRYIEPFLQTLKESFGTPLVVVRDMSKQIRDVVSYVFPGTPQQICHYHFVKNLGKLIFKERYAGLRRTMVGTKILGQIAGQKDALSADISSENMLVVVERKWTALAIEYLLWPREQRSGFPFVLPYFEVMNRVREVRAMARRIVRWNASHNLAVGAVLDFSSKLEKLAETSDIRTQHLRIKKIWRWFERVRKVLGVSRHLSKNGQKVDPSNAKDIERKLKKALAKIEREGREMGGELQDVSEEIAENCRQHWGELIVEVKDRFGNDVKIVRHNGIEERGHRWSRMHIRRRTGRTRTTNEMAKYGALTAVFSNLENEVYVKKVLADVNDFMREMQDVTVVEIEEAKKLIRPYLRKALVRSDAKRADLLKEFIEMLENSEDKNDVAVEKWLSKFD